MCVVSVFVCVCVLTVSICADSASLLLKLDDTLGSRFTENQLHVAVM